MAIASDRSEIVFRRTEKALLRLGSDEHAETVHSFRTAARRLELLLSEFSSDGGRNERKLVKALNRIRDRAGKVRDIDAQLAALRSLKVAQQPRRKTQLTQTLVDLRAQHDKKLAKLLTKKDIGELARRLRRAARNFVINEKRDPLTVAQKMVVGITKSDALLDERKLRQLRKAVKSARYVADLAPKSADSSAFVEQLRSLQDALGSWHDWLTLTQTATEKLGSVNQSSLVAALTNVTRGKFRNAIESISSSQVADHISTSSTRQGPVKASQSKNPRSVERSEVAA